MAIKHIHSLHRGIPHHISKTVNSFRQDKMKDFSQINFKRAVLIFDPKFDIVQENQIDAGKIAHQMELDIQS